MKKALDKAKLSNIAMYLSHAFSTEKGLDTDNYCDGFNDGVSAYLNHLWHDADKEQPKYRSTVIVCGKGYYEIIYNCSMVFQGRKWAYIEDILPK